MLMTHLLFFTHIIRQTTYFTKFGRKNVVFTQKFGRKSVENVWKFGRKSVNSAA